MFLVLSSMRNQHHPQARFMSSARLLWCPEEFLSIMHPDEDTNYSSWWTQQRMRSKTLFSWSHDHGAAIYSKSRWAQQLCFHQRGRRRHVRCH